MKNILFVEYSGGIAKITWRDKNGHIRTFYCDEKLAMELLENPKQLRIWDYIQTLIFVLPLAVRFEVVELYFQTKGDIEGIKKDLISKGYSRLWVWLVILVNIGSVVFFNLVYLLRKFTGSLPKKDDKEKDDKEKDETE